MMNLTPQEFRAQLIRMVDDRALVEATVAQYAMKWEAERLPKARKVEVLEGSKSDEARYAEEMAEGSEKLLRAIKGTKEGQHRTAKGQLIWRTRTGLDTSNGRGGNYYLYSPNEPERTDRDPCPRCGARGDYDCGHAPVRGGRLAAL